MNPAKMLRDIANDLDEEPVYLLSRRKKVEFLRKLADGFETSPDVYNQRVAATQIALEGCVDPPLSREWWALWGEAVNAIAERNLHPLHSFFDRSGVPSGWVRIKVEHADGRVAIGDVTPAYAEEALKIALQ